jgi:hypothetical protein
MYSGQADGWTARQSGSIPRRGKILYFTEFMLAVGPGKPPIEGVSGTLIRGVKWLGRGADHISIECSTRNQKSGMALLLAGVWQFR